MQNGVCGLLAFEGEQQTLGSRTHVSVRTGKHRCARLHAWSVSEHAEGGLTTSAVRAEGAGRRSVGLCDRSRASHWSSSYSFLDFLEFGRYGCIFSSTALAALSRCVSRTMKAPVLSDRSVGLSAAVRHQHDRSSEHGPPQPPCPSAGDPVPPRSPGQRLTCPFRKPAYTRGHTTRTRSCRAAFARPNYLFESHPRCHTWRQLVFYATACSHARWPRDIRTASGQGQ